MCGFAAEYSRRRRPDRDAVQRLVETLACRGPHLVIDRPKGYFPVPALSRLQGALLELWLGRHGI